MEALAVVEDVDAVEGADLSSSAWRMAIVSCCEARKVCMSGTVTSIPGFWRALARSSACGSVIVEAYSWITGLCCALEVEGCPSVG